MCLLSFLALSAATLVSAQQCVGYYDASVDNAINAGQFPPVWGLATILANDNTARAKYNSIQSQIPNIPPKGYQPQSIQGDWSGFSYSDDDPDCWWTYSHCSTPKIPGLQSDITTVPESNTLGYCFDDGPNCTHNAFYDFLLQKNQKATLFYIASNIADWPNEARRGHTDGHEICVHTWSHPYMTALTNEEVFAELYYYFLLEMIQLVIGIAPTCWRPPYGDIDDRVRAIAQAMNLRTVTWSFDSFDWEAGVGSYTAANVDANYKTLISNAQNGNYASAGPIMLAHELNSFTMGEAMTFYDQIKAAFADVFPIGAATGAF